MGSSLTKKELGRIVDGLSLISKEVVKRSRSQNGDLQSLITSSLKKAILVVTDLSGLTTGEVREFSTPPPPPPSPPTSSSNNSKATTSVVYFEAAVEENQPQTPSPLQPSPSPSPSSSSSNVGGKEVPFPVIPPPLPSNVGCDVKDGLLASEANVALDKEEPAPPPPPPKIQKRRPRERRVPSTPFSRALGEDSSNHLVDRDEDWYQEACGKELSMYLKFSPAPVTFMANDDFGSSSMDDRTKILSIVCLGAGLAWGTIQQSAKRIVFGMPDSQEKQSALSPFLSEKNAERLALASCRMRGAALKLGQMLSIQDESIIPPPVLMQFKEKHPNIKLVEILAALDIVRQGADVMPMSQLNQVLDAELGPDWSSKLISFDYEPMAAASIGQPPPATIFHHRLPPPPPATTTHHPLATTTTTQPTHHYHPPPATYPPPPLTTHLPPSSTHLPHYHPPPHTHHPPPPPPPLSHTTHTTTHLPPPPATHRHHHLPRHPNHSYHPPATPTIATHHTTTTRPPPHRYTPTTRHYHHQPTRHRLPPATVTHPLAYHFPPPSSAATTHLNPPPATTCHFTLFYIFKFF
ncbi:hypothetical protein HYC85_024740 [Camellia sinensis]|uniref:ABC1 atypical kinase-like domain-containing protein n=1 Tax=Camellia sinensis TaxID=4442 RepID=A0A7J7GCX3_CAMSI|nr:hypothetical protein HYC85_024740 [Camellia sinensis]